MNLFFHRYDQVPTLPNPQKLPSPIQETVSNLISPTPVTSSTLSTVVALDKELEDFAYFLIASPMIQSH